MSDLMLRIVGKDDASGAFNQVAGASKRLDAATRQVAASQSHSHRAFSTTKRILTGIATSYAAIKVGQFAKDSIMASSDVREAMTATSQVFKKQSSEIKAWSKGSAADFGQTRTQALSTARQFGTLFKSAGVGGQKLGEYSTGLTELASDIASFNNVPVQQAIEDMTSGLSGQVEPMRKYGVFLSANALKAEAMRMGIADGTSTLTDQQRTLASYNLILRQTGVTSDKFAKQFGDFDRTSEGFANQTRILSAEWGNFKAQFGKAILPLATSTIKGLNQIIPALSKSLSGGGLGKTLESWGPKAETFFTSLRTNLPEITGIAGDFADAAGIIGNGLKGVFDTFNSLPDGVRQGIIVLGAAAATMKMLNRAAGGGGMTAFGNAVESIPHAVVRAGMGTAAAEAVKAMFGNRIGSMQIQAGVVNVNGAKVNGGPGGVGGNGATGRAGAAGVLALLGSAAVTSAITVAAGKAYYELMDPEPKRRAQGGNPTIYAGGYGSDRTIHTSGPTYTAGYQRTLDAQSARQTAKALAEVKMSASDAADAAMRFVWQYKLAPKAVKETARDANEVTAAVLKAAQHKTAKVTVKGAKEAAQDAEDVARKMRRIINRDARVSVKGAKEAAADAVELAKHLKRVQNRDVRVTAKGAKEAAADAVALARKIVRLTGKTVPVKESGAKDSQGRVKGLGGTIGNLKGKTVPIKADTSQAITGIGAVAQALTNLDGRTVNTYVRQHNVKEAAGGGLIRGPGTSTSDSIDARLSDGEYVIRARAVDHYGVGTFDRLNAMRFAKGGPVKRARKDAQWQATLAKAAEKWSLDEEQLAWLSSLDRKVARKFIPSGTQKQKRQDLRSIRVLTRQSGAVGARSDMQAAQHEYGAWSREGNFTSKTPEEKKAAAEAGIEKARQAQRSKNAKVRAKGLRDEIEWTQKLNDAQQALKDAEAERAAQAEEDRQQREAAEDAQLDKVNQLRDAVDGLAGGYRSFASISTTAVTDVTEAQSKLTDANDAVAAAQKKMDLAGSDRERAAAAAELSKALADQQSAQKGVNEAGKPTSASIRGNMAAKLAKIKGFSTDVKKLKDQGLNATTLSDILAMGPEQGADFAKALLDGGLGDINELQNQITQESASLGYFQHGQNAASDSLTGYAAAQAAGLVSGGVVMAPAPVTVSIDGNAIAQALISYKRQNGGSAPGLNL